METVQAGKYIEGSGHKRKSTSWTFVLGLDERIPATQQNQRHYAVIDAKILRVVVKKALVKNNKVSCASVLLKEEWAAKSSEIFFFFLFYL